MERLFRYSLRFGALALLAVGVILVLYSMQAGENDRPVAQGNAANAPQVDTPVGTTPPADTALQGTAQLDFFEHPVDQDDEKVIILAGPKAYVGREKKIYTVVEPVLTSYDVAPDGTRTEDARLTARGAVWREESGVVELEGQVLAGGRDYQVETSSVIFDINERTLTTDSEVRITGFRTDETGERTPVMHTVSQGMKADLVLSSMELSKLVTTTVYSAAADMFADDAPSADEQVQDRNLVITCHGPAVYEHSARNITYQNKVRANGRTKVLACDRLSIHLEEAADATLGTEEEADEEEAPGDEPQATPRMTLSQVRARGSVELRATMDETTLLARGDELNWQNLAQIITLTGQPAEVDTDAFHAEGQEVRIVRMTAGYRVEGKGSLIWKPAAGATAETTDEDDQWQPVPLEIDKTQSTRVSWTDSMHWDTSTNSAAFSGQVQVTQAGLALACDKLSLRFNRLEDAADGSSPLEPAGVIAQGDVTVEAGQRQLTCQKLEWDAETGAIVMKAAEGRRLSFTEGPMTVFSRTIEIDKTNQRFRAPGAGRLTVGGTTGANTRQTGEDLVVTWQKEAVLQHGGERHAEFHGDVKAVSGTHRLEGQKLNVALSDRMSPTMIEVSEQAVIDVTSAQPAREELAIEPELEETVAGADRWRLTGKTFTIDAEKERLSSNAPGVLTMFSRENVQGTLSWKGSMALDLDKNSATFTEEVVARTDAGKVMGEKLTMQFGIDRETGRRTIKQIGLQKGVRFVGAGERALAVSAESALAVFDEGTQLSQLIAHDKVVLTDQERTMKAGRLVLKFDRVEDESGETSLEVVSASAEDDVHIDYDNRDIKAGADRVDWNRTVDSYTLTGDPAWIVRGGLRSQGKTLTYFGSTGNPR